MKLGSLKSTAQSYLQQYEQKGSATYAAALQAIGGILILDGFTGIENPFGQKKRSGIFGALGGVVVGIIFMFVPQVFNSMSGIGDMTATTSGSVVSVSAPRVSQSSDGTSSSTCAITASYVVDGKQYKSASPSSSTDQCGMTAGQAVSIDYNPDNPASWAYGAKTAASITGIFFWVGIAVLVVSLVTAAIRLLSIIFGWKLLRKGRALAATLPADTSFGTIINEIRQDFAKTIFNFGGTPGVFSQPVPSQLQFSLGTPSPLSTPIQPTTPAQAVSVPIQPQPQPQPIAPAQPTIVAPQQMPVADAAPVQPVAAVMQPAPVVVATPTMVSPEIQPIVPQSAAPTTVPQTVPVEQSPSPRPPQAPLQ